MTIVEGKTDMNVDKVRALLSYDPETGIFTNRIPRRKARAGAVAGIPTWHGYLRIEIEGKKWYSHRLAWLYVYGEWPDNIDHIDGNKANNRISNLRAVTHSVNKQNSPGRRVIPKGVYRSSYGNKWRAQIRCNGSLHNLGTYQTVKEAHEAYALAAKRLFGELARI